MGAHRLDKDQQETIRMVFQRLCENEASVQLLFGTFRGDFRVLAEAPDRVSLGLSEAERAQWGLKPKIRLSLQLLDRGLPYEGQVEVHGQGKLHDTEVCQVTQPRVLRALDTHRLAEFVPDRPVPCPFADQHNNILDGQALAFGEKGLELAPPEGVRFLGELLQLNTHSTVELRAALGEPLVLPVRVAYFGERVWGLRISEAADKRALGRYRQWLVEASQQQAQRDHVHFSPRGFEAPRMPVRREPPRFVATPPKVLVDRDPVILVLAEEETFPARLAEGIGRKFGVVALDPGSGPVRPLLGELGVKEQSWGRVGLVLIHHRLRSGSAMDRCRRLLREEACPLPILLAGTEEKAGLKRNRAVDAGAVDYLVVEPFHVLSVLHTLARTLQAFS